MIDINKKYRTRGGREVRIYSIDANNLDTVHGAHLHKGQWMVASWGMNGARCEYEETSMDLIEVKPRIKQTVWLAVYPLDDVWLVSGDCTAVEKGCLACVKVEIDVEEGHGL